MRPYFDYTNSFFFVLRDNDMEMFSREYFEDTLFLFFFPSECFFKYFLSFSFIAVSDIPMILSKNNDFYQII